MRYLLLSAWLVGFTFAPAAAQTPSPAPTGTYDLARDRIDSMLRTGHADAALFNAGFLSQISVAQVDGVIAQVEKTLGQYKSLEGGSGDYTAHFARGTDEVTIHFDSANQIDGLLFKPPQTQP